MKFAWTGRTLPLAVALALTFGAVAGAYALAVEWQPTPSAGPAALAVFNESTLSNFTANVQPSALYGNTTHVQGGNVTLYAPLTNWINATVSTTFTTNRTASILLHERFEVRLATPQWTKLVTSTWLNTSSARTTGLAIASGYDANVSAVLAAASAIDRQLNYTPPYLTLTLAPVVTGTVTVGGVDQSVNYEPDLVFTFSGTQIAPSGLAYTEAVPIYPVAPVAAPTPPDRSGAPVVLVAASVGGLLALAAWSMPVPRAAPGREESFASGPRFPALVETGPVDNVGRTVPLRAFPDLVRVAVAIGKPILRPVDAYRYGNLYLVLDGDVAYAYEHSEAASLPSPETEPEPVVTPATGGIVLSQYASNLHRNLRFEARRMLGMDLAPEVLAEGQADVRVALDALRHGDEEGAANAVQLLTSLLDQIEAEARAVPAPGSPVL